MSTSENKPSHVLSPFKGKHAPEEGKHNEAAQRLEDLVEKSKTVPGGE